MPEPITLDLWSDIVCPWCWIGKHRLQRALESAGLEARWRFRAYELGERSQERRPTLSHLAQKYGVSPDEARGMLGRVRDLGAELGLDINPDVQKTAPTFDAHRLVKAAEAAALGPQLMERLHRAHFSEGRDLGDRGELAALAAEAGLDLAAARRLLETDAYAADVEADEERAAAQAIGGVPFTVINGRFAVSGAQSVETFRKAFARATEGAR